MMWLKHEYNVVYTWATVGVVLFTRGTQRSISFCWHSGWATARQSLHFTTIFPKRTLFRQDKHVSGMITWQRVTHCYTDRDGFTAQFVALTWNSSYRFRNKHVFPWFLRSAGESNECSSAVLHLHHWVITGRPHWGFLWRSVTDLSQTYSKSINSLVYLVFYCL